MSAWKSHTFECRVLREVISERSAVVAVSFLWRPLCRIYLVDDHEPPEGWLESYKNAIREIAPGVDEFKIERVPRARIERLAQTRRWKRGGSAPSTPKRGRPDSKVLEYVKPEPKDFVRSPHPHQPGGGPLKPAARDDNPDRS